ncbi:DNA alkylation repair enzyme [Cedecea neteri]|uniref:DNA alkylation repair enzyme n=1 Tax=Cedecea neteri TaxID=158822 RepID=A0A2X3J6U6_9ENTR|nr:DNA alkylation repair enzyme [Cedecea neteri]
MPSSSSKKSIALGENLEFKVSLRSTSDAPQNIVVDYVLHFMKANGSTAPKVFKLRAFELPAGGIVTIEKKHAVKKITHPPVLLRRAADRDPGQRQGAWGRGVGAEFITL